MKQVHNAKYYILKENRLNQIPLKKRKTNKQAKRVTGWAAVAAGHPTVPTYIPMKSLRYNVTI